MNFNLAKRQQGGIEFGIIYGLMVMLALAAARLLPLAGFMPGCAFRALTGFPCPTCGTTRSLVHLSHARLLPSLAMNPLASMTLIVLILAFFYYAITLLFDFRRLRVSLSGPEKDRIRIIAVAIVLLNWLYLLFVL